MKKVVWEPAKLNAAPRPGQYRSMAELIQKSEAIRQEQAQAMACLQKAMPAMLTLLGIRIQNGEALRVMRPIKYTTSCLKSEMETELDKSFYNSNKNGSANDHFVDVIKTINPGTTLVIKALNPSLREFVCEDGMGNSHDISFDERNVLLTQTDIFETIQKLLDNKGE